MAKDDTDSNTKTTDDEKAVDQPYVGTRVNLRFGFVTLIAGIVLAVCIHVLHGFQVRRNARWLLESANAAREQGDSEKAIQRLARYALLQPHDTDALATMGMLLDQTANSG